MTSTRILAWVGAGVFALMLCPNAASFGDPPTPKDPPKGSKTKVFRLQHCDPNEATSLLDTLLQSVPIDPVPQPPMPQPLPQGQLGFGGFGGQFGGQGAMPAYSTAQDPRTRAIIVRGNDKHLQMASDFATAIDVPKGKAPPAVKTLRAVQLKHANPTSLAQTIEELNYDARIIAMPAAKMLLFTGSEEVMNEISALVKDLDIETPPEPKPGELRPLVNDPPEPKKEM